ncbi:hypothetical protein EYF80_003645 [Liparis tanakae]|uniref:Uncharacterized protein n=1 Tax=Liparis tanakae TaxID=230148 RepID=A0A4Z2J963_9TELE|nr:hypothetical protein EYF80_003645 [Liparis tanakae]
MLTIQLPSEMPTGPPPTILVLLWTKHPTEESSPGTRSICGEIISKCISRSEEEEPGQIGYEGQTADDPSLPWEHCGMPHSWCLRCGRGSVVKHHGPALELSGLRQ